MSEQPPEPPEPVTGRIPMPRIAGSPVILPDLRRSRRGGPSASRNMAAVHTPAYTRGAAPRQRRDARATRRDAESLPGWLRTVLGTAGGAELWFSQPHSLSQAWELHSHSARYFDGWAFRWLRYGWAAVHLVISGLIYLLVWATQTLPRALALAAVIALVWWLI